MKVKQTQCEGPLSDSRRLTRKDNVSNIMSSLPFRFVKARHNQDVSDNQNKMIRTKAMLRHVFMVIPKTVWTSQIFIILTMEYAVIKKQRAKMSVTNDQILRRV